MEAGIRIFERCNELALLSEDTDALTRVYLSEQHQQANQLVGEWMRDAGMHVWQDAVGNICGRYEGAEPEAPALLFGSHLDTVRNAGKYDGMLGVITAIELVSRLHQQNKRFPFAIEVVGFGDEEGVRFGVTLLGSRGLTGSWGDDWLDKQDSHGISLAQALRDFGLVPELIHQAKRKPDDFIGYLELHIEQGPLLESTDLALGVVTAINGAKRLNFSFKGVAGHAGTVPMSLRQDALVGASELILAAEFIAKEFDVVATVGKIACHPGAVNVIPSEVSFTLDIRAPDNQQRDAALFEILKEAKEIATRRGLELGFDCFYSSDATPCAGLLQEKLTNAVTKVQGRSMSLASGAGHDAIAIAALCEVGMLFMRCKGGISHNPAESVQVADIELALQALMHFLSDFH
ncbi:allantoate amidohydrolase [Tolumonas osonensis]|uniref:Allantoate deiminase n=1 Tax=Tolumonas osonensis TaxID=675874 RepID=A0A841G731_9GAMM|nr:allantoate amidohydrolase [Tolumonas osonensis]MBB6054944.1 allantoate deiminase [Tolumonas osonensis]